METVGDVPTSALGLTDMQERSLRRFEINGIKERLDKLELEHYQLEEYVKKPNNEFLESRIDESAEPAV